MPEDNPFEDDGIPPEHVLDELQWCRKEVGYARTEVQGTPRPRLEEVYDRLNDIQETLEESKEMLDDA